jgi:hypothetical protein
MNEEFEQFEKQIKEFETISFNVKFLKTDENMEIFKSFKEFCQKNTQDNYLLGIKMLLDYMDADWKYECLFNGQEALAKDIYEIEQKMNMITNRPQEKEKDKNQIKTFGGE